MISPETYIKNFAHLRRAPNAVFPEATKNRAPHKPILLLAVLDLVHRGVITTPFIDVTADLVELNELFNLYWRRVVPLGQTSSIAFPFSRLSREPFWELVPQPGKTITDAVINNTSSVSYLRKYALGAKLDDGLFQIMQSGEGREALREALLRSCFSEEAAAQLREQSIINREAFDYSRALEEQAHLPLVKEIVEAESYRTDVRDQAFRKSGDQGLRPPLRPVRHPHRHPGWPYGGGGRPHRAVEQDRRTTTSATAWPSAAPATGASTRGCSAFPTTTRSSPPAPSAPIPTSPACS